MRRTPDAVRLLAHASGSVNGPRLGVFQCQRNSRRAVFRAQLEFAGRREHQLPVLDPREPRPAIRVQPVETRLTKRATIQFLQKAKPLPVHVRDGEVRELQIVHDEARRFPAALRRRTNALAKERDLIAEPPARRGAKFPGKIPPLRFELRMGPMITGKFKMPSRQGLTPFTFRAGQRTQSTAAHEDREPPTEMVAEVARSESHRTPKLHQPVASGQGFPSASGVSTAQPRVSPCPNT